MGMGLFVIIIDHHTHQIIAYYALQEAQLLTQPEELEKIQTLKEKLEPSNLPPELVNSGEYICGTQISKQEIW